MTKKTILTIKKNLFLRPGLPRGIFPDRDYSLSHNLSLLSSLFKINFDKTNWLGELFKCKKLFGWMSDYGILGLMICLGTDDLRPLTHHLTANTTTLCVPQRDFDTTLFQYPIWHEKQISTVRNLNSVRSISYLLHYPISQLPHCMLTCSLFKANRRSNLLT